MITSHEYKIHDSICSALGFGPGEVIFSASDNHKLTVTTINKKENVAEFDLGPDAYPVDLTIMPSLNRKGCQVCVACSDGSITMINYNNYHVKLEKKWPAHEGAAIQVVASPSGSELASCGEDGVVKVWSKSGLLRSTLTNLGHAVYALDWSPDGSKVVYACQSKIEIKTLTGNMKQTGEVWTAHEPVVSCVTWGSGDTIASGGEDGKYKIWDLFGRLLFQSAEHQFPITSISFSPNAESLLVGTFGIVKFCDPSGKSISSVQQTNLGSPFRFCWSQDNLIAATGTGSGKLLRLDIAGVKVEDDTHQLEQMNSKAIKVTEIDSATTDMIETTERITSISTGYKNIVIGTTEQLQIFVKGRLNTPQLVELKEHTPNLIKQTDQLFAVVSTTAIIILTYEGRIQSENRFNFGLTAMNLAQVALNSRFCIIVDPRDARNLIGFENLTGKAINGSVKSLESSPLLTHKDNIRHVELQADQHLLSFVDEQKDLYIMKLDTPKLVPHRIMSNVTAIMTSSTLPVLSILKGSQVEALINPAIAFVDNALVAQSTVSIEATNLGRNPRLFAFNEGTVSLRNHDGSVIRGSLNPLATLLIKAVKDRKLTEGLSICRFAADKSLWMTLSGFALEHNQTEVLAECYKALGKVDRVRQINRANETSDKTLQVIELKALGNEPETMDVLAKRSELTDTLPLLFAKCAWKEALDLAIKKGSHIDTVLYFRSHYLKSNEKEEDIEKFREMNQKIDVSWEDIKAKYPMTA